MVQSGNNGRGSDQYRRILERLATIKIHTGIIRRWARRDEPLEKREVIQQLDLIDQQAAKAAETIEGSSPAFG